MRKLAFFSAAGTVLLIAAGSLVTSTGSGLSVPDWPTAYGKAVPPFWHGGVVFEYGHRVIAGGVLVLTLSLAAFVRLWERRRWVRRLMVLAVSALLLQALLGGITVLWELPAAVSVSHALLAQLFFGALVVAAFSQTSVFRECGSMETPRGLRKAALGLVLILFFQIALGAVTRHLGAGLAIPDYPTAFGGFFPPEWTVGVAFHFLHRWFAVFAVGFVLWFCRRSAHWEKAPPEVFRATVVLGIGALMQMFLGPLLIFMKRDPWVTGLHVVTGAVVFAAAVFLATFFQIAEHSKSSIKNL